MTDLAQITIDELLHEVRDQISLKDLDPEVLELIYAKNIEKVKLELPAPATSDVVIDQHQQIPEFFNILDDVFMGNNVFLFGPAGTGKTTLAEKIAEALKRELIVIKCSKWTSPTEIIGGQTMEGYKEGGLIEAWRDGKLLVIDELPKLDPNTAGLFNDPLAKTAHQEAIIFNGANQPIPKHKNFGVIATGNTTGKGTSSQYGGNNKQDASLIDRFSGSYYKIDFNRKLEKSLVFQKVFEICDMIRDELIAHRVEEIMTLRTMLNFNRAYLLEMLREIGKKDKYPNGASGKTLQKAIDSYFQVMSTDKATDIKNNIDLPAFLNNYKDRKDFLEEYKNRFNNNH